MSYYPTYGLHAALDADTTAWLGEAQGHGPLDLCDVTDVCATMGVTAVLRDEQGSVRGHVDAKGDYRLT